MHLLDQVDQLQIIRNCFYYYSYTCMILVLSWALNILEITLLTFTQRLCNLTPQTRFWGLTCICNPMQFYTLAMGWEGGRGGGGGVNMVRTKKWHTAIGHAVWVGFVSRFHHPYITYFNFYFNLYFFGGGGGGGRTPPPCLKVPMGLWFCMLHKHV